MALDRGFLQSLPAAKPEVVTVPEWAGAVRLRALSGTERDAVMTSLPENAPGKVDMRQYRARLVAACAVDDADAPLLTVDEALGLDETQASALLRLFNAATRINGLRPEDAEAAKGN